MKLLARFKKWTLPTKIAVVSSLVLGPCLAVLLWFFPRSSSNVDWPQVFDKIDKHQHVSQGDSVITKTFWLTREPGATISLGPCPGERCLEFSLGELTTRNGALLQQIFLSGAGFGIKRRPQSKYLLEMHNHISVSGALLSIDLQTSRQYVGMWLIPNASFEMTTPTARVKFTVVDIRSDALRIRLEVKLETLASVPP